MAVYQIAQATGETLEAVCNMQEKEREELINVLGLEEAVKKAQKEDSSAANTVIDTAELDSDSDDEVLLPYTAKEDDHIWVSSDEGDVEVVVLLPAVLVGVVRGR